MNQIAAFLILFSLMFGFAHQPAAQASRIDCVEQAALGALSPIRHRALEDSAAFAMVQRISPDILPMAARRLWARALDLAYDNPGVSAERLLTALDATEFMPLVLGERDVIRHRREELDNPSDARFDAMTRFIDERQRRGRLSGAGLIRFSELHDGVMSESGAPSEMISQALESFPSLVFYPEPRELSVRDINALWSVLANPLGFNLLRSLFDELLIDDQARHDLVHAERRTVSAPLSSLARDQPLAELERIMTLHREAYRSYLAEVRLEAGAPHFSTRDDLAELFWSFVDHEHNEIWKGLLLAHPFAHRFQLAGNLIELKTRLRSLRGAPRAEIHFNNPEFTTLVRTFFGRFIRNDFDQSIADPADRLAIQNAARYFQANYPSASQREVTIGIRALRGHPEHSQATEWLLAAVRDYYRYLGTRITDSP